MLVKAAVTEWCHDDALLSRAISWYRNWLMIRLLLIQQKTFFFNGLSDIVSFVLQWLQ